MRLIFYLPQFLYFSNINVIPSKQFPRTATHGWRRCSQFWQQHWKSYLCQRYLKKPCPCNIKLSVFINHRDDFFSDLRHSGQSQNEIHNFVEQFMCTFPDLADRQVALRVGIRKPGANSWSPQPDISRVQLVVSCIIQPLLTSANMTYRTVAKQCFVHLS